MAGDTANPRIWVNADVYVAPVGTTAPIDVTTAWAASWAPLGLLSEDGMTESRDQDSTDHYAWGGILVRTTRSKHKRTITVTALEDNLEVWGLVNPGSTATTAVGPPQLTTRTVKVPSPDPRAFGIETRDTPHTRRRTVPRAEVVEVGEVTASDAAMQMYELTLNVYPASDGTLYVDLTDDPQTFVP